MHKAMQIIPWLPLTDTTISIYGDMIRKIAEIVTSISYFHYNKLDHVAKNRFQKCQETPSTIVLAVTVTNKENKNSIKSGNNKVKPVSYTHLLCLRPISIVY